MSEAIARKQEADLTAECDKIIPSAESLAKDGQLDQAIDKLFALEKQCRNAADLASTSRVLLSILSLLWESKDQTRLQETILALSKKHGQLRQATVRMVEQAMTYLDQLEGQDKLKLIETLREITEGKIYLEVQRARVTRQLVNIKENQDKDITAASDLLQDLAVETFGSMERREKTDFILEQMRLLYLSKNWDKLAITSKKVNTRWLVGEENQDLKLRFYQLMVLYALQHDKYLDASNYYKQIFETPSVQADEAQWRAALRNTVLFVILARYDNEQHDLLARVSKEDKLPQMGECHNLVKCFTTPELMRWPGIQELYGPSLRQTRIFGEKGTPALDVGDVQETEEDCRADKRWKDLHSRVVEHNVRTISKYYTRITLSRMAELLDLSVKETEETLAALASSHMIYAKIDRPAGVVNFVAAKSTDKVLNEWSSDVSKLMGLIEKTSHLIAKEQAVAAAKLKAAVRA